MSNISDKAIVSPKARLGQNVTIYPFAYVEDDVEIGDGCVIHPFVSVLNGTRMGANNTVYQGTVLGAVPQDFDFTGEATQLVIGKSNTFRENVVINRATHADGKTVIGNDNFLMEGAHVSHDTHMGNQCVLGYGTKIAGNCEIGNQVIFSTSVVCNEGCRVGTLSMVSSSVYFSQDIPPFIIATGSPVRYGGINQVMLSRIGVSERIQRHIANAYRLVFHGQTSLFDAIVQIKAQIPDDEEIRQVVEFLNQTELGIISKK